MEKQILVPLDGTMLAHIALPHAATLARATSSRLILLHVIPPLPANLLDWEVTRAAAFHHQQQGRLSLMQHYLEATAEDLRDEGLLVHAEMIEGEPASTIVTRAEKDLLVEAIVMTTHGRRGVDSLFVGSITEKVQHASPVHLLLVHPDERMGSLRGFYRRAYRTILVPLNGSVYAEHALEPAQTLAAASATGAATTGAQLLLLAVVPSPDAGQAAGVASEPMNILWAEDIDPADAHTGAGGAGGAGEAEQMRHYLCETAKPLIADGFSVAIQVSHGNPAEEIPRYAGQANADLIVMPTDGSPHGPSHAGRGFGHLLGDSVATRVMRGTRLPVLLARAAVGVGWVE